MVRTGVLLRLTSYFLTFSVGSALVTSGGPRAATPSLKLPLPTSTSGLTRIGEHKQLRLSVPFIICVHSMHANQMVLFSLFCIVACILSYHLRRIPNVVLLWRLYHTHIRRIPQKTQSYLDTHRIIREGMGHLLQMRRGAGHP